MKMQKLKYPVRCLVLMFIAAVSAAAQGVPRDQCFPFEKLSAADRKIAEELLLKALDEAALYTFVGNIKALSTGIKSFQVTAALPRISSEEAAKISKELSAKNEKDLTPQQRSDLNTAKNALERQKVLDDISAVRRALAQWRCGDDIFAAVQHFSSTYTGKRFMDVAVFSRPGLKRVLTEKADFFSRWGVTPESHPLEVLYAAEYERSPARNGAYGYLFGYPDHAVRFFVDAVNEEDLTGKFVTRDFVSIPTFARETNFFVYAVPKGYQLTAVDTGLRDKAAPILAEYRKRREKYIGEGKAGVVELIRDWYCNADGLCSSANTGF